MVRLSWSCAPSSEIITRVDQFLHFCGISLDPFIPGYLSYCIMYVYVDNCAAFILNLKILLLLECEPAL